MKEFLLIFRRDQEASKLQRSPEQMEANMKEWQNWMGGLAAQDKLSNIGNRLDGDGK